MFLYVIDCSSRQLHFWIPKYLLSEFIWTLTKGRLCLLRFNYAFSLPSLWKWDFEERYTFLRFGLWPVRIFIIMHSSQVESASTTKCVNIDRYFRLKVLRKQTFFYLHSIPIKGRHSLGQNEGRWTMKFGGGSLVLQHPSAFFYLSATSPTCWKLEYLQTIRQYIISLENNTVEIFQNDWPIHDFDFFFSHLKNLTTIWLK